MVSSEVPPKPDEFEVSLFGPGIGESITLHLGHGDWVVVDSCRDTDTGRPAALAYLDSLGVDVAKSVKLLVLTHWHDDHIRGAASIFRCAASARVAWSSKYDDIAFYEAVETARESRFDQTGLDEMSRIVGILLDRRLPKQRPESVGPMWAAEGTKLFTRAARPGVETGCVTALSPSHGTQTLAIHELRGFLPEHLAPQRRAVRVTPNQRSVVLHVQAGERTALLGADLETSANPVTGWRAIVDSPIRPQTPSEVFKVPHHGSRNAHNATVWSEMLTVEPIACVTPFLRGKHPLPTPADLRRLLQQTSRVFCTRRPRTIRPKRRIRTVERTIREVARFHRVVEGRGGHVRIRAPLVGTWNPAIDLFGEAFQALEHSTE